MRLVNFAVFVHICLTRGQQRSKRLGKAGKIELLNKRMVGADIADVFPGFAGPFDSGVFELLTP